MLIICFWVALIIQVLFPLNTHVVGGTATQPSNGDTFATNDQQPVNSGYHHAGIMESFHTHLYRLISTSLSDSMEGSNPTSSHLSNLLGDGTTLAWGGSTLEVVRTQAVYATRPAAFGPHISNDKGQRGILLPISRFYKSRRSGTDMQSCAYEGGPGWKEEHGDDQNSRERRAGARALNAVSQIDCSKNTSIACIDKPMPPENWIALVERGGGCSFVEKVRVSQALGATAVVVGDEASPWDGDDTTFPSRLVTMFGKDADDIKIPSTFVTRPSFLDLQRLLEEIEEDQEKQKVTSKQIPTYPSLNVQSLGQSMLTPAFSPKADNHFNINDSRGLEIVLGRDDIMWEWPLIDLALLLLLLPSLMTITTIIVHRIRLARTRRRERAPVPVVQNLPCLIWRGDGKPWEKVDESSTLAAAASTSSTHEQSASKDSSQNGISQDWFSSSPENDVEHNAADDERNVLLDEAGPSSNSSTRPSVETPQRSSAARVKPSFGRTYYSCDECAICLSAFVDGEHVRVLPCRHVFHRSEVDDWLLHIRKVCPICKRDITVPVPPSPPTPDLEPVFEEARTPSSVDDGLTAQQQAEENHAYSDSLASSDARLTDRDREENGNIASLNEPARLDD